MRSSALHLDAYNYFRAYLDNAYSHKIQREIYGLSVGYPTAGQFELPKEILRELVPFENGHEKPRPGYGWEAGSLPLREAVLKYENAAHGTNYTMSNISIVAGATYGFNRVLEYLFTDKLFDLARDELLVVAPTFYRMLGRAESYAEVRNVCAKESNNFQITIDEIVEAITPQTKAIFLLNPSNPTYLYYSNEFLEDLVKELQQRQVYLIIDESGDAFVSGGEGKHSYHKMTPKLQDPYVIRIVTASKKYLLAEYRIGYVLAHETFIGTKQQGLIKLLGDDMSNPPLAANEAWLKLLEHEIDSIDSTKCHNADCDFGEQFERATNKMLGRRRMTLDELARMAHISKIIVPDANYNLLFALDSNKGRTDIEVFRHMLENYDLSLVPGSGFGINPNLLYFRLTFALKEQELANGLKALKAVTESSYL